MPKFKVNDIVRINKYKENSINGYGRIQTVRDDGTYWVVNGNMPFIGTVSAFFREDELSTAKRRK